MKTIDAVATMSEYVLCSRVSYFVFPLWLLGLGTDTFCAGSGSQPPSCGPFFRATHEGYQRQDHHSMPDSFRREDFLPAAGYSIPEAAMPNCQYRTSSMCVLDLFQFASCSIREIVMEHSSVKTDQELANYCLFGWYQTANRRRAVFWSTCSREPNWISEEPGASKLWNNSLLHCYYRKINSLQICFIVRMLHVLSHSIMVLTDDCLHGSRRRKILQIDHNWCCFMRRLVLLSIETFMRYLLFVL